MLNELEKKILDDVFEMSINNGPIVSLNNYNLVEKNDEENQEFGSYLLKLRSLGYLKFEDNIFTKGGRQNKKYRNNILGVRTEGLNIDKVGISFVVKDRETFKDKVTNEFKDSAKSLYTKIKEGLIGFIAGLIIAWITGLINI